MAPQPSTWRGRSEQISLDQVGCEARKIPAEGDVFFLDFYLYRTYRDLTLRPRRRSPVLPTAFSARSRQDQTNISSCKNIFPITGTALTLLVVASTIITA